MHADDTVGEDPCFAHMLVDGAPVDPDTARDVARFRAAERARLIAARRALPGPDRAAQTAAIVRELRDLIGPTSGLSLAVYWPIRGEPDLRDWMAAVDAAGGRVLLPVAVRPAAPLTFRHWRPGCAMTRGVWDIPVPADGPDEVPDTVVAPVVGVDAAGFRLGHGGGYYDRTLARIAPMPRVIGVGFPLSRIATIYPMPWDVAMHRVALGDGGVDGGGGADPGAAAGSEAGPGPQNS